MSQRILYEKIGFLYKSEDVNRVIWKSSDDSNIVVTVDLHKMSRDEAKRFIKNIISIFYMCSFTFEIVHGYNHGTAIKEMIRSEEINPRIRKISSPAYNPGLSILEVASL